MFHIISMLYFFLDEHSFISSCYFCASLQYIAESQDNRQTDRLLFEAHRISPYEHGIYRNDTNTKYSLLICVDLVMKMPLNFDR